MLGIYVGQILILLIVELISQFWLNKLMPSMIKWRKLLADPTDEQRVIYQFFTFKRISVLKKKRIHFDYINFWFTLYRNNIWAIYRAKIMKNYQLFFYVECILPEITDFEIFFRNFAQSVYFYSEIFMSFNDSSDFF